MQEPGVLRLSSLLARRAIVLDETGIVELDANFASDRIKRLLYERIQCVSYRWRLNSLLIFLGVLLIALAMFLAMFGLTQGANDVGVFLFFAGFWVFIAVLVFLRATFARRVELQVETNVGSKISVKGIASLRKFRAFVDELTELVREHQAQDRSA